MSVTLPSPPRAVPDAPAPARPRLWDLRRHGDRRAIVTAEATLDYTELADTVDRLAASWGPARRLVLVEAANRLEQLVCYLAATEHGHVALVASPGRDADTEQLVRRYDPDIVCRAGQAPVVRREASAHRLHPDLSLLLSTSGSTGSPRLVRLSRENLRSNAASIAEYLELTDADCGVTALPLHYCYGLSVLHSHLLVGGAVALTELSVVDECFWTLAREARVTSLPTVPYTVDLLDRSGFADRKLPSLRVVTQAGGRLEPDRVRRLGELGRARGWELMVMYGQTEATARMAWLPPRLRAAHPDAVGVAVPGGRLRLDPVPGAEPGVGELVYAGPNVMMGYATCAGDLDRGAELTELRTGDLATITDGVVRIVGRRSRVAKVFGLRIDLDRVERALAPEHAVHLVAPADRLGDRLHAFTVDGEPAEVARAVADRCGIPGGAVTGHRIAELPRTGSGKPDYAALTAAAAGAAEIPSATPATADALGDPVERIRRDYALVLGRPDATPADSFTGLGGDSLSYVELATRLEALVPGGPPAGWHTRPIRELAAAAQLDGRRHWPRSTRVDTTIGLRTLATLLILGSHADLFDLKGGAHLLLAVAGYNFARFQLAAPERSGRVRNVLSSLAQLAVPTMLWIVGVALLTGGYRPATALFLNGVLGADHWTDQWQFWFLEALVWILAGCLALLAVPALDRAERAVPFRFAVALVLGCAALRLLTVGVEAGPVDRYRFAGVAGFFALGWLVARARTHRTRLLASVATVATTAGFFGEPRREAIVAGGVLLVLWLPRIPMPRPLVRPVGAIASASLFVYLTQWQVYPWLEDAGLPVLAVVASVLAGIGYGALMRPVQRRLAGAIQRAGETAARAGAARQ